MNKHSRVLKNTFLPLIVNNNKKTKKHFFLTMFFFFFKFFFAKITNLFFFCFASLQHTVMVFIGDWLSWVMDATTLQSDDSLLSEIANFIQVRQISSFFGCTADSMLILTGGFVILRSLIFVTVQCRMQWDTCKLQFYLQTFVMARYHSTLSVRTIILT